MKKEKSGEKMEKVLFSVQINICILSGMPHTHSPGQTQALTDCLLFKYLELLFSIGFSTSPAPSLSDLTFYCIYVVGLFYI